MVDIEQRALCALVQNAATIGAHIVQDSRHIVHQRANVFTPGQRIVQHFLVIDRLGLQPVDENEIVIIHRRAQQRRRPA